MIIQHSDVFFRTMFLVFGETIPRSLYTEDGGLCDPLPPGRIDRIAVPPISANSEPAALSALAIPR